ncbi:hypothetical protein H8356DRAFT_1331250 [Neocallimastix lanati (nom. inval.)]|nr:hypothetical protein H8356DRAFT_1331250 [Neocallimastix sp. JGI-2020a]
MKITKFHSFMPYNKIKNRQELLTRAFGDYSSLFARAYSNRATTELLKLGFEALSNLLKLVTNRRNSSQELYQRLREEEILSKSRNQESETRNQWKQKPSPKLRNLKPMETETKAKNKKSKANRKNLTKIAKQKPKTKETENPRDSKNKVQKENKKAVDTNSKRKLQTKQKGRYIKARRLNLGSTSVTIKAPANPSPQYLYAIPQTFYRTFRNSTFSISFGNRWTNNYCLLIPIQIITLSVLSYPHYYIIQSFVSIILPDNPNPMIQEKPSSYTELEELSSLVLHSTNRFGSRLGAYVTEGVRLKLYSILKFYFVLTRGTSYNSTDGFFYSCESIVYTTSKATEVGLCFPNNKLDIIKNLTILLPFVYKTLTIDFICVITKRLKELIV